MTFLPSQFNFNELPGNTIVPDLDPPDVFIQYFTRLYEDIAFAVNNKDNVAFTFTISNKRVDIPNLPPFGAVFLVISGVDNTQPCGIWALSRSDNRLPGTQSEIANENGTDAWAGKSILISTDNPAPGTVNVLRNFQIRHDRTDVTANFNLRIVSAI